MHAQSYPASCDPMDCGSDDLPIMQETPVQPLLGKSPCERENEEYCPCLELLNIVHGVTKSQRAADTFFTFIRL